MTHGVLALSLGALAILYAGGPAPLEEAQGVVFEVETTVTRIEIDAGPQFRFRMMRVRRVDTESGRRAVRATDLSRLAGAVGTFRFKGTDEELQVLAARARALRVGAIAIVTADCDELGDGRDVDGEVRFEGDRRSIPGTVTFDRIDVFEEVCRSADDR